MTDTAPTTRRSGRRGRAARAELRQAYTQRFLPEFDRGIPYMDALLPEQVEIVHDTTMKLLETTGIEFRDDEAADMWREVGADVDGYRVRIDRQLLMELVSTAPADATWSPVGSNARPFTAPVCPVMLSRFAPSATFQN